MHPQSFPGEGWVDDQLPTLTKEEKKVFSHQSYSTQITQMANIAQFNVD